MSDGSRATPEAIAARRREARLRRRRRRRLGAALAALATAAGAVVLLLVLGGDAGSDRPPSEPRPAASATARPTTTALRAQSTPIAGMPLLRGDRARRAHVPVLMYHVIARAPASAPYPDLFVEPSDFAAQMRALARRGYHGVTLAQVDAAWRTGAPLPRRAVVITFDDGYFSQYKIAGPVLRKLGWPGVLNLAVKDNGPGGISRRQVRELIAAGWELASHTIDHLDVSTLSGTALRREIADSRRVLRRRYGVAVDFFCYPAGRFDAEAVAAVRSAGYKGATTTEPGLAAPDERFTLRRVRVSAGERAATLLDRVDELVRR